MALTKRISTGATLSWNAASVGGLRDFGIRTECDPKDCTDQDNGRYRDYVPGMPRESWSCTVLNDERDTVHAALRADKEAGTPRTLLLTTPEAVAYSVQAICTGIGREQQLGEVVMGNYSFELNLASTVASTGL